jgi:hypothetical protein
MRDRSEKELEALVDPICGYFELKPKAEWGTWFADDIILADN